MTARYAPGDAVRVRVAFPPGHVRAPHFIRGKTGVVDRIWGDYRNPEELAYGNYDAGELTLYCVRFRQADLWPDYAGPAIDTTDVDIYENWLEPVGGTQS